METSGQALAQIAKGHHYSVETIQISLQQVINCGNSLRGVEKTFELYVDFSEHGTPSFSSIRKWLGRIGLYELNRKKEYRSDWIFIVDLTVELGTEKALVVLGVSQQLLEEQVFPLKRGLGHQDVELLALEIMYSTKGEYIEQKLSELTKKVGRPVQIIADHGSDIQRGIKLYQQQYPEVIYTYDVTHAMALLLKHELVADEKYQSFIQQCTQCRQQLQQTELSFLSPPSQRSQCRYFNIERLINWAIKLLDSPIDIIVELVPNIEPAILRQKLKSKLGWLINYQESLSIWSQMVQVTRTVETHLKTCGLNQKLSSVLELQQLTMRGNSLVNFQLKIIDYLTIESSKIQSEQTILATSDVIESLFGKYKQFSSRCPFKQIGQMILSISLSTMKLTGSVVKLALETVRYLDLEAWSDQVFGQSMLSKR
ncbi:hypothetical protein [Nostoc flagelliforme]|uniref:hypothetical protein n=1 Tax=Nostoc flagelliforme TaxID=1306274 RepID=UPI001F548A36|nr:hypothetical protein [Nostoc flagelliforme]